MADVVDCILAEVIHHIERKTNYIFDFSTNDKFPFAVISTKNEEKSLTSERFLIRTSFEMTAPNNL